MNNVSNYCIASAPKIQPMEALINKLISEGWIPLGGLGFSPFGYHQAMVKYKNE